MQHKIVAVVAEVVTVYFDKRIPKAASALSYSLIFTLFPFLICLNAMLGSLDLTQIKIVELCEGIMPAEAVDIISTYFTYISETSATTPLFFMGLIATLTSSAAAFRSLLNTMDEIHGAPKRMGFFGLIFSFILSVAFLIVIYASCIIIVCGKWLMKMIEDYFDIILFVDVWKWLRFVVLFVIMFTVIYAIYKISTPRKQRQHIPRARGALFASLLLGGISIVFSRVITFSTRYTVIYGSLASIIVLLMWLYASGCVLFLGNIVNIVIYKHSRLRRESKMAIK